MLALPGGKVTSPSRGRAQHPRSALNHRNLAVLKTAAKCASASGRPVAFDDGDLVASVIKERLSAGRARRLPVMAHPHLAARPGFAID